LWSSDSGSRAFEDDELAMDLLGLCRCPGWKKLGDCPRGFSSSLIFVLAFPI
jgi:hypothetical protein